MRMMMKCRLMKSVAWLMVSALLVPYSANMAVAAKAPQPVTQTVLVFPLDNSAGPSASNVSERLTDYVRGGLAVHGRYMVIGFSDRLPAVQQMIRLNPENSEKWSGPFYGSKNAVANAIAIGKEMSADLIVVGTIDKYTTENGAATLGATVELVNVRTGKSEQTVVVMGHSGNTVATPVSTKPSIEIQSVDDAGQKIVTGITGTEYTQNKTAPAQTPPANKKKKKSSKVWLGVALAGIAIGLLASHHSSGSSGDPSIPPPPF